MPADIGPAAERVLAGCLDMNVASRWTIAMVDEDAWGIGWSSGGTSPSSDRENDCDPTPIHPRPRTISVVISDSGSPPHPHNDISEESPLHGGISRGSPSSSRSRSPSGVPRKLSFIPASLFSLNDSILGTDETRNFSDPSTVDPFARGRPRTKFSLERSDSRSLSPSVVPLTPQDLIDESTPCSRRPRGHSADSLHEGGMGRVGGNSRLRWGRTDLDDIEETSAREKWSASRFRHTSKSRLRDGEGSHNTERRLFDPLNMWDEFPRGRSSRAGTQRPRSSSSASREKRLREIDRDWACWRAHSTIKDGSRETMVERTKARSRSAGFDFSVEKRTGKFALV